jgi:TetR/AcrR family transcriptional regulator, transcriptional repressor of aconitase
VPKVSQEYLDARRAQILEGAERCFARHGYSGATVARLEEEIGLSRGAIFNYFEGKQDLFAQVATRISFRFAELLGTHGLDAAVRTLVEEADPDWLAVLIETESHLRHDPEFMRRLEAAFENAPRVSAWIAEQQEAGALRTDLGAQQLAQFVGMLLNGLALRIAGGDETDVDSLLHLLHDALAPRE